MARRKSSGLLETLVKAVFQTGTTVNRRRDCLGRKVTTVKHHDTGKTKTYTHGTGLFNNTTRTVTTQNGNVTERGKLKSTFFGTPVERAERAIESVKRKYGQGLFGNKVKTTVTDNAGNVTGSGVTSPGFFGGTRSQFARIQNCHHCGASVSSDNGRFQCVCGRVWGRR
jgi:hypothetical protein